MQSEAPKLRIELKAFTSYEDVLDGLDAWFEQGLISEIDLRWREDLANRKLTVIARYNERLLAGLNYWLEIGLIDDQQVLLIARTRFICDLEDSPQAIAASTAPDPVSMPKSVISGSRLKSRSPSVPVAVASRPPSQAAQTLRSLLSEFSTMWLLFLGVFLVVVSSGLLAASQWNNFSAQGQYLLLFAYTLGFLGTAFWTSKSENLRLTARALQLVTLLLIPANFWAIDGLGLLTTPTGIAISAIAGLVLSAIAIFLLQTSFLFKDDQSNSQNLSHTSIASILVLSWLHLGWIFSRFYPFIAVYLGIAAIATSTILTRRQRLNTADRSTFPLALLTGAYSTVLLIGRAVLFANVSIFKLGLAIAICGWILLQITAKSTLKSTAKSTPSITETTTSVPIANNFQRDLGKILLGLGWLVSVSDPAPWQALVISLVIAWQIGDRLLRLEQAAELTWLFGWGLQILWLVQRLIPIDWQTASNERLLLLLQADSSINVLGILLFPYLLLSLAIADIYRQHQKHDLARRGESLALGFGILLTILSGTNLLPLLINISLSTVTLFIVQARRLNTSKDLRSLIYFTNFLAIFAGSLAFYRYLEPSQELPQSLFTWTGFILGATAVQWSVVVILNLVSNSQTTENGTQSHRQLWHESTWFAGLGLATMSYVLLRNFTMSGAGGNANVALGYWGLGWLAIPIALAGFGLWRKFTYREIATNFSIAAIALAQTLTWQEIYSCVIGLGVAVILMLVNTRRHSSAINGSVNAFITVGYGLTLIGALLFWQASFVQGYQAGDRIFAQIAFVVNGVIFSILLLYMLTHWLKYRRDRQVSNLNLSLNQSYTNAFNIWAALLSTVLLLFLSCLAVLVFGFDLNPQIFSSFLPSIALVTLSFFYRLWQAIGTGNTSKPPFWTQWGIAWSIELLTSCVVAASNGAAVELAIANLALGFCTQLLGDWWMRRTGTSSYPRSWDVIPLVYGVMGSLLRIGNFTNLSGLFSLGTSLIGIGIGRRGAESHPAFKVLTYISMAIATFSAYELLFYQMLANPQGGSLGTGLVALATLACAIAYAYRLFNNWIAPYLRLPKSELAVYAHFHWFASGMLLFGASFYRPATEAGLIGGAVAIALAAYAIERGKLSRVRSRPVPIALENQSNQTANFENSSDHAMAGLWIYLGITSAIAAIYYLLIFAFPNPSLISSVIYPYAAAIACGISLCLYLPPWQRWGWSAQPWHNAAFYLPLIMVMLTNNAIAIFSTIIVSIFYIIYALRQSQIRATYITVLLWNWLIFRIVWVQSSLAEFSTTHSFLISVTVICLSGIYFTQVEPSLKTESNRDLRHVLRSIVSGALSLVGFFYSFDDPSVAIATWSISVLMVIGGLAMRVRAYLFVGTLTFILLVLSQAAILITKYSFLMWALGIIAGIGFIFVAANFEARRDRILALFRSVEIELEDWE